ncbi:hypothetical protein ACFL52_04225 [Candidatus Margulisiibacteriota bacterium]
MKKQKYEKPELKTTKLSNFFFACVKSGTCVTVVSKNNISQCNPA